MELRSQVAVTVAPAAFEDSKTKATKPSKLKGSRALPITIIRRRVFSSRRVCG